MKKESGGMAALWGEPCLDDGAVGADLCRMGAVPLWEADLVLVRHDPAGAPCWPSCKTSCWENKLAVQYATERHELGGVFFSSSSSPFSFSVAFVDKADLLQWMNVLVAVKLTLSRLWRLSYCYASGCLVGLACRVIPLLAVRLWRVRPCCSYQNLMWLDVMALFRCCCWLWPPVPGKPLAFVLALSAQMVLSFYLSYMVVLFLLLGFGAYLLWIVPKTGGNKRCCWVALTWSALV